ncbi:uncharacterized protein LOC122624336 [Drosophila teissieri]|uniref:uncharacterized protein LOC122624336 n=1 Tax=Drosophila teissieri TaxID=7243 RepID=UPI001CBA25FC|nr:uncharacterized protein LOC122624336 [Drosophila teissieri]
MSWLTKIIIIVNLLVHIQLAELIRYLDEGDTFDGFSSIFQQPKKQRSWDLEEDHDPDRDQWKGNAYVDSQSGICPAENPQDVRYEKKNRCKAAKKIVKDEDDDEDADPAANSDTDDDSKCNDGDEEEGDDEADEEEAEEMGFEDEAFVARINCLLGSLHKHTKAMTDNLKVLQSRLTKKKDTSCRGNSNSHGTTPTEHPSVKWSKKPDFYGRSEPCGDERCYTEESAANKDVPPEALTEDRRLVVPPLLQLFHGPVQLQATLNSGQDITGSRSRYWMPSPESPNEFQPPQVQPEEKTQVRYEEYEARLRRLMDNRDEIERNVMKMMSPAK